jgi:hypothetical protein
MTYRQHGLLVAGGIALIGVAWTASWSGTSPLAYHAFFPLWLGYILAVSGITGLLTGSSLPARGWKPFTILFACSIPFWWIFELLNLRLQDWHYQLPHRYSWFAYRLEASFAFSTVVPAIFVTAELWFALIGRRLARPWFRLTLSRRGWATLVVTGVVMLILTAIWPRVLFPLAWISLFFIIDPLVHVLGGRSIATGVATGNWRPVWLLFLAGLTCGFFWEMWNVHAMPKWTYSVPYVDRAHLFEMPLLGYGGYLPFAVETYAVVKAIDLALRFLPVDFLRFDGPLVEDTISSGPEVPAP